MNTLASSDVRPPSGVHPLSATYAPSPIKAFAGNPLIEALPAIKTDTDWLAQLLSLPAFDPEEVHQEAYLRCYYVSELKEFFQPTARHLELARRLDLLIRTGYRHRHPLQTGRVKTLQRLYDEAQAGGNSTVRYEPNKPICSMSLIGVSGGGKTTTTEAILASYYQYIHHPAHDLHQIVWLKAECPKDGSIKELALNVLRAFEAVLGIPFAPTGVHSTASGLLAKVKQLAMTYHLGVLVLDELQNLCVKKSGGREEMLNFFQELVNELRIPVVLLGTFKASSVLGLDLRHARRNSAGGGMEWKPLEFNDEWRSLVRTLWRYQWVKKPAPLDEATYATLHAETQGIRALLVDMYAVTQLHAMRGAECVTPELFKKVARTEFAAVQPMLNALRSKDPLRLRKFEDLGSYDIDELLSNERLLVEKHTQRGTNAAQCGTIVAASVASLRSAIGMDEHEAREIVARVNDGSFASSRALTKAAAKAYFASAPVDAHTAAA